MHKAQVQSFQHTAGLSVKLLLLLGGGGRHSPRVPLPCRDALLRASQSLDYDMKKSFRMSQTETNGVYYLDRQTDRQEKDRHSPKAQVSAS